MKFIDQMGTILCAGGLIPGGDPYENLDPAIAHLLSQMRCAQFSVTKIPVKILRWMGKKMMDVDPKLLDPIAKTSDVHIHGPSGKIPLRLYLPKGEGPFPVLVYFHGGGWVLGSVDESERICRAIAARTPCMVVSVGYRLAPEHRFPEGLNDSYAATLWVAEKISDYGGDAGRLCVGGESAGGNLAAVIALMARDQQGPKLTMQWLAYPVTNYFTDESRFYEALDQHYLTIETAQWFWSRYVKDPDEGSNPLISPFLATTLEGLPPALLVTAEHDPLTPQGHAYAKRLRESGVSVESLHYDGMIHGFLNLPQPPAIADQAYSQISTRLREQIYQTSIH